MSREKKELSKLLERYENTAEDFYHQMKRYYETGITTSVQLPFTPQEVKKDPTKAIQYILEYKVYSYNQVQNISETMSLLFEMGPILFTGDKVSVNILDEKVITEVPPGQLEMDRNNKQGYTITIKLLKSGAARTDFESNIHRDLLAEYLKEQLKESIYVALRSILFDGFSDNPEKDLEICNEISQPMGVVIKEAKDVEKILDAPHNTDLGLRDLEQIYMMGDLLRDENWWIFNDVITLQEELKESIYKRRQSRIDSPIADK